MRIPTVLGLSIVTVGLVVGVIKTLNSHNYFSPHTEIEPIDLQVVNLTDTQASFIWQTQLPTFGVLNWGNSPSLGNSKNDDRDPIAKKRVSHFFTLTGLQPNTTYYYQTDNDNQTYPPQPLHFTTAQSLPTKDLSKLAPLTGVVLDPTLHPVDEAIVTLESPLFAPVSAFTITAGNFVIPTSQILNTDLSQYYQFTAPIKAQLTIRRGTALSLVKLTLPPTPQPGSKITVVLGNNLDLTAVNLTASPSSSPTTPLILSTPSAQLR